VIEAGAFLRLLRAFDIASVAHGANRRRRSFSSMQHFRVTHRARAIGCPATNSRLSREADRHLKFDALNVRVIDAALQFCAAKIETDHF